MKSTTTATKSNRQQFKSILLPISSEFYQKTVFERGAQLAQTYGSTVHLVYIIEEKTLDQAEKSLNSYLTDYDKAETKKEIIRRHIHVADSVIFEEAQQFFTEKNIAMKSEVIQGEFSEVIKGLILKNKYDLVFTGFEKECMLHYRLFDEVPVPVWVESGNPSKKILAVCSNLAPNTKVPQISQQIASVLGWELTLIYIVDIHDAVMVDTNGVRSAKKPEKELLAKGHQFIYSMEQQGIPMTLYKGSLEKQTIHVAQDIDAGLIILGREQKKKQLFGLSSKSVKKKMAEQCQYSFLFVK